MLNTIKNRKMKWVGHVLRHKSLLRDVMKEGMQGKRPRERKRMMLLDDMNREPNDKYIQIKGRAENKEEWKIDMIRTCQ